MHILLVEDSRSDASIIMDFIAEEENPPTVSWAMNGQEALDYLYQYGQYKEAKKPDMILLDLALPTMGGYEFLEALQYSGFASIPIIILTTSDNPADAKNCKKLGAKEFFSKPYDLQGYVDLVQQMMSPAFSAQHLGAAMR
jgi:CheY-like chemotaxis protein